MGNLEQALDLGQGVYTQAEIDAIPSSLSKVASNVLLSGNLALASSAVTKSNANITYTGNGSTQSITTGIGSVDFTVASNGSGYYHDRAAGDCTVKNDAGTIIESGTAVVNVSKVHIKSRSLAYRHGVIDGLRGVEGVIFTEATFAEDTTTSYELTSFDLNGFTLPSGAGSNQSGGTYIAHQTLYTHIKWGLTNQGKRYITAYNPVTREVMTMYQGSGIAGHQIPNALGIKLDYIEVKNLDSASQNWGVYGTGFDRLRLNDTLANLTGGGVDNILDSYIELNTDGETNSSGNTYISYGFANSETKIITQYQGTGVAGNFVETKDVNGVAKKPRRVIFKRTDAVGSWGVFDSSRPLGGVNTAEFIFLDTSGAATTETNISMEFSINGFTIGINNAYTNASGGQYIAIVEFDTTSNNDDTYFDLPTDDTNLNVLAGKLPYTDGRDTTNGAYNVFTQSYTGSVDFSTCPDGIHYVALDSNNAPKFYKGVSIGSYDKEAADDNRLVFNTDDGKWYTTTGGELVTNGTFDSDTSGWTAVSNNILTANGTLSINRNNSTLRGAYQEVTVEVGEIYEINIDAVSASNTVYIQLQYGSFIDGTTSQYIEKTHQPLGSYKFEVVATDTLLTIVIGAQGFLTSTASFDNISVYKKDSTLDTPLTTPISFIDDKPYQVASGTPMDRLEDYPSIPKNVMESSYVDGDLEVSGEVKGKNQCTAWVNFDGTTTPPTIRDSFNVSDVVRVSNGIYEVYFEKHMDNITYSTFGSLQDSDSSVEAYSVTEDYFGKETNKVRIISNYNSTLYNFPTISIQTLGGK